GDGRSQNPGPPSQRLRLSGLHGNPRVPAILPPGENHRFPVDRRCRCEGFMKGNRLTRIQWRIIRFVLWVCLSVAVLVLSAVLVYYRLDPGILWASELFSVPLILLVLLLVVAVGVLAGYGFGNQMKKRLEHLLESALKYERGQFAHRIPPLGDDEIGRVAEHLNRMARRVEQQVASLQKLATEKA